MQEFVECENYKTFKENLENFCEDTKQLENEISDQSYIRIQINEHEKDENYFQKELNERKEKIVLDEIALKDLKQLLEVIKTIKKSLHEICKLNDRYLLTSKTKFNQDVELIMTHFQPSTSQQQSSKKLKKNHQYSSTNFGAFKFPLEIHTTKRKINPEMISSIKKLDMNHLTADIIEQPQTARTAESKNGIEIEEKYKGKTLKQSTDILNSSSKLKPRRRSRSMASEVPIITTPKLKGIEMYYETLKQWNQAQSLNIIYDSSQRPFNKNEFTHLITNKSSLFFIFQTQSDLFGFYFGSSISAFDKYLSDDHHFIFTLQTSLSNVPTRWFPSAKRSKYILNIPFSSSPILLRVNYKGCIVIGYPNIEASEVLDIGSSYKNLKSDSFIGRNFSKFSIKNIIILQSQN
ncbi:hypothetical protein EHI8A_084730 [Entamoeba histolytica HM-1:IMSS-B]|uniref:TLDc domain-containing protein n=6 Tax=Entamoeba histolytica TaxID=5759 RepID=C4LTP8_ENTH1|nr:hypothetical protein EHI_050110 [Entamoeba histolytica HM-1:IMSS]EMD49816.1 Hypothetical protein EHI5A_125610 [Entamoeba histolytica KU27]EMH74722.1 hypothetical protein EHI8A_084730 [Entamoeba histolytica HM-1:IMSS-B]EMS12697.1 hypothetical protein KM1_148720 [Entamoeba histolytica HM-3:IMSS]ENY60316.1 hypothetical protein EHI7A_083160 [Entamoeba histolytica HM-1:IMSS-A]GAT91950.1 hypothetical protein CL6EHI_050110 [Entamoeba histolytica]|eukprot:XP_657189.1 hypothetical protein EHI_050110 [Entamoeba histolytica HM-1:IMSS]